MNAIATADKPTTSMLAQVKEAAEEILADSSDLEVANHAQVGPDWVTIADMADPAIARNNCWAASNEIYEYAELESYADIHEVDIVGVECAGNSHYAVYLANREEEVVLDFTARQFVADAPFPLVMPLNHWHAYMEHLVGKKMELAIGD